MMSRRLQRSRWVSFFFCFSAAGFATAQPSDAPVSTYIAKVRQAALHPRAYSLAEAKLMEESKPQAPPETPSRPDAKTAKAIEDLGESPLAAVFESMTPEARAFAQHNITLSNPYMDGRVPGSNGNKVAADYIEFYFKQAKLKPAFPAKGEGDKEVAGSSYRQPFQHGTESKITQQTLTFHPVGLEDMKLVPGVDFNVLGMSGSGEVKGNVVFCGYGIEGGPDNYKTIPEGADFTGMIAIVMRFEPINPNGTSLWAQDGWSPAASLDAKIENIAKHKPAAIIVTNPPGATDPRSKQLIDASTTKPFGKGQTMPVIMATSAAVDRLVKSLGTLEVLRGRCDEAGLAMVVPGAHISVKVSVDREPVMTDNVGAVLHGKGSLADQYIVIGAHYDHVGYGPVGTQPQNNGKLHPGADDNGSGTSGVLVLADKIAKAYEKLGDKDDARSILFLTFSAEESGLIGSRYFVNHPSIDLTKVAMMLNMDMIGRLRTAAADAKNHGLDVEGTESADGFYEWLKPHFDSCGFEIKHGSGIASNSDHFSFYSHKIPVLFFFSGYHRQYHTPDDTFDTINQVGAGKVISLGYDITMALAKRPEPLVFKPKKEDKQEEQAAASPGPVAGKVRFGIAPASYSDDKPGIEVGDVFEGTSAADAGIKIGDRMTKWNGTALTDVESWMPLLTKHKPGDVVEVTLLRDGKEMTLKVTLKARDNSNK